MYTHAFPFDPTYGYRLADLCEVPPAATPPDFAAFWKQTYEEAQRIPLRLSSRQVESRHDAYDLWEVDFDSLGHVRIGAWMTVPKNGNCKRGVIHGHGYGNNGIAEIYEPAGPQAMTMTVCKRGFGRSQNPLIPNVADKHVVTGIAKKETYVLRGCVADVWCAARALMALYPETAKHLHYLGSSFGGGIGALALPWESRFEKAFLGVPTFGNHPLRLTLPCIGSGDGIQKYYQNHPEVVEVLAFFDASIAASFIRVPTFAACALFDPAVPPPGQFAVYNALGGPKECMFLPAAHFDYPEKAEVDTELNRKLALWFT